MSRSQAQRGGKAGNEKETSDRSDSCHSDTGHQTGGIVKVGCLKWMARGQKNIVNCDVGRTDDSKVGPRSNLSSTLATVELGAGHRFFFVSGLAVDIKA